jgi:hypothetical protein
MASIIGPYFTSTQLQHLTTTNITQQLQALESRDLVELIGPQDNGDLIYRFTKPYLRQALF